MGLKLFKIWQEVNTKYDSYDSAVVVAESEYEAVMISPDVNKQDWNGKAYYGWCDIKDVNVICIGNATGDLKAGDVIVASFNAG